LQFQRLPVTPSPSTSLIYLVDNVSYFYEFYDGVGLED